MTCSPQRMESNENRESELAFRTLKLGEEGTHTISDVDGWSKLQQVSPRLSSLWEAILFRFALTFFVISLRRPFKLPCEDGFLRTTCCRFAISAATLFHSFLSVSSMAVQAIPAIRETSC